MITFDPVKKADIEYKISKEDRVAKMNNLTVTSDNGKVFDADKAALDAISSAVTLGEPGEITEWKLADNSVVSVTWEELKEVGRQIGYIHTTIIAVPTDPTK